MRGPRFGCAMWQVRMPIHSRSNQVRMLDIWVYRHQESKAAIGPGCKKLTNAWGSANIKILWIADGRSLLLQACRGP